MDDVWSVLVNQFPHPVMVSRSQVGVVVGVRGRGVVAEEALDFRHARNPNSQCAQAL